MVFGDAQIRGGGSKSRDDSVYHYGYHNLFDVRSDYYSHPSTFAQIHLASMLELWFLYSELAGVEFASWEAEPPPETTPKENTILEDRYQQHPSKGHHGILFEIWRF